MVHDQIGVSLSRFYFLGLQLIEAKNRIVFSIKFLILNFLSTLLIFPPSLIVQNLILDYFSVLSIITTACLIVVPKTNLVIN